MNPNILIVAALWLSAVHAAPPPTDRVSSTVALLQGRYDNRQQVEKGRANAQEATPHVVVDVEKTPQPDWMLWHVHIETDAESSFDQTWAMQARVEYDGSVALIPSYQLKQDGTPDPAQFDPGQWLSLEACALRGRSSKARFEGMSEGEPCVAVSMSVGARRALMPVGIVREGNSLHLDLNLRGTRTRIDAVRQ